MTTNNETVIVYAPIPPDTDDHNYVILPVYRRQRPLISRRNLNIRRCLGLSTAVLLLLLIATACLLFPSDPELTLVRLRLNGVKVRTSPHLSLDLSLSLTLRVRNRDFLSLDYSFLDVAVGYRGRQLGFVTSGGGHIKARGSSYVNATLVIDGFEVIHDAIYLLEDLARGSIPFDSASEVKGTVGLFFIKVPIKARISCEVFVNVNNQTIIRQDCYAE